MGREESWKNNRSMSLRQSSRKCGLAREVSSLECEVYEAMGIGSLSDSRGYTDKASAEIKKIQD